MIDELGAVDRIVSRRGLPTGVEDFSAEAVVRLRRRALRRERDAILWVGAAGTMLSETSLFEPHLAEDVGKALRAQYPQDYGPLSDGDIASRLREMDPEQVNGLVSGVKGKLFELKVVERLNSGEAAGEVDLAAGQWAEIAPAANQPGYDILVHNADGSVAEYLSAKCSDNARVAREALEKYPQFQIVGNEELAAAHPGVVDAGLTEDEIAETVSGALEEAAGIGDTLDIVGDFLPGLPLVFVLGKHGIPLVLGRSTLEDVARDLPGDLASAALVTGVGAALAMLDAGILSLPAMFVTRAGIGFVRDRRAANRLLREAAAGLQCFMQESRRFQGGCGAHVY